MDVIATHENTDFDALAAMLAASKLFPGAIPVLPHHMNRNLRDFLTLYWDELPFVQQADLPRREISRLILVDTQYIPLSRGISPSTRIRAVDHHPRLPDLDPHVELEGDLVGACVTLLIERLGPARPPIEITPIEATVLLLGIYEDTGSLSFATTTPRDVRAAGWLLEHGGNLDVVNKFLRYPLSDKQQALYTRLVENSKPYEFAGQTVIISSTKVDEYVEEISTLAHKLRDLFEPDALFVIVDLGDHTQFIARSTSDAIDVSEIAALLGGGGHSRAAAALVRGQTLAQVETTLTGYLQEHVQPAVTVREIMSYGVHTVSPDTTVSEAAEQMARYGHEGFPVVEQGRVVGIVTRRDIDRAMHHRLGGAPVRMYMLKGEVVVEPSDSVERLRTVMVQHGVGQVPVVEEGQVIGIVTRTDLIKLWASPWRSGRRADQSQRIVDALPPALLSLVREAGVLAESEGWAIYVVGGFVRDLLLGIPNLDLDIVVEGDALKLARRLCRKHGGHVHPHRQFGTAKWFLDTAAQGGPDMPDHIDLATARTEFYTQPTVLPTVEKSSIKLDLNRRDFTINTLAIRLNPAHFGELLDYYGGERDLRNRTIRVLHSLSFVEDPTRMLRAARFELRLGFHIEPQTEELIRSAADLLDRVTGSRVAHELLLILDEDRPERILARLDTLSVLRRVFGGLRADVWLREKFALARDLTPPWPTGAPPQEQRLQLLYLALLAYRLDPSEAREFAGRLRFSLKQSRMLVDTAGLAKAESALNRRNLRASQLSRLLDGMDPLALEATWIATDSAPVRSQIERYMAELRHIKPLIHGDDLRAMGVEPGPVYKKILAGVLDARLDGSVTTREDELALARRLLEDRAAQPKPRRRRGRRELGGE